MQNTTKTRLSQAICYNFFQISKVNFVKQKSYKLDFQVIKVCPLLINLPFQNGQM